MSGDGQAWPTEKLTLQTILQLGYAAYERQHRLPDYVRRAVWALLACRTVVLGGHVQACPEGHVERIWYNSCRHRMCPPCAWIQVERWLARQRSRLLACEHDHVIFTMPHELNELWLANVAVMTQLLFASVHETLFELLGDAKYLCLVTGGGLNDAGHWVAVRNGFLLPMRVVMGLFRGKLRAAIRQGVQQGQLRPPEGRNQQQVENLLNKLGRTKWNVHIRERYPYGHGVLISLARYLRGGPLSNRRLLACDGQQVVFWYEERAKAKGAQAHRRTLRLPLEQFLGRWLLHVPPARAVRVRCWGRYAHTQGTELARCRQQVGQGPVEAPELPDWQRDRQEWGEVPPAYGPVCGQPLVCTALLPRAGVPPPADKGWEQVA